MPRPFDTLRDPAQRPLWYRRLAGILCLAVLALYTLVGCQTPSFSEAAWPDWASFRSQSPDEVVDEEGASESGTSLETPYVGEYVTSFGGTWLIPMQGVGLVIGLDNTGEDPPPSYYRTRLVDEMRKHKIEDPNAILAVAGNGDRDGSGLHAGQHPQGRSVRRGSHVAAAKPGDESRGRLPARGPPE